MTIILGIDPGLQKTGWGIIRAEGNRLSLIGCGTIKTEIRKSHSPLAGESKLTSSAGAPEISVRGLLRTGTGAYTPPPAPAKAGAALPRGEGLSERLHHISIELARVIESYKPNEAAIEETFVSVNGQSTLKLGQARGAILLTLAQAHLPVAEYAATLVKKSVTGAGRAEKSQVAQMVQILLPGCGKHGADAMDALAVAITHAHHATLHKASKTYA